MTDDDWNDYHAMIDQHDAVTEWADIARRLAGEVRLAWQEKQKLEAERHADETARAAAAHRAEEGDSELAGEVELLRERVDTLQAINTEIKITCEAAGFTFRGGVTGIVSDVCDAYRSEKDRADRLQAQLDAQPQVEAVGWFYNLECGEDITLASHDYISSKLVPDRETRRRIFVGPAEPIASEVQP